MANLLEQLVSLLELEKIEENIYRGYSQDLGLPQLYGGQTLGQALSAATHTVDPQRPVHSMHAYFVRRGDARIPVLYSVERLIDGSSTSRRRVTAIQKGQAIFTVACSFQEYEPGLHHQLPVMPYAPGPEGLLSTEEIAKGMTKELPEGLREHATRDKPVEIRPVLALNPYLPQRSAPAKMVWMRANGAMPGIQHIHRCVLAYASDFSLLTTTLQPHGVSPWQKNLQIVSLDHSLWFHEDVQMDEWLLYVVDSPWSGHARGFARGSLFSRDGRLVASVAQEGLIRLQNDD